MEEPNIIDKLSSEVNPASENPSVVGPVEGTFGGDAPFTSEDTATVSVDKPKPKSYLGIVLLLAGLAVLAVAAVLGYIFLTGGFNKEEVEEDEEETEIIDEQESEEITWVDYEGEYITAKLPEGWEIEEYDGEYLTDDITGFPGIVVSDDVGTLLLEIYPAPHIGWSFHCPQYYLFEDGNVEDYEEALASAEAESEELGVSVGDEGYEYELIEVENYSAFDFLQYKVRRVKKVLQSLINGEDKSKFSRCETPINYFVLIDQNGNELYHYDFNLTTENAKHNGYVIEYPKSIPEAAMLILDQVLESIEIIPQEEISAQEEITKSLVGSWHASASVGSGYDQRYMFEDDGTFQYFGSEYVEGSQNYSGTWELVDSVLTLTRENEIEEVFGLGEFEEEDPEKSPYPWKVKFVEVTFWKISDDAIWDEDGVLIIAE